MTAKRTVVALMAVMAVYLLMLGHRGVLLIAQGSPVPVLLGIGVLILPVIGVTILVSEWRFGAASQRLGRTLANQGWTPGDDPVLCDLPRRPSGRVDRDAADQAFEGFREQTEQAPEDWRCWYRLAVAYDLAGDRHRGRRAMRHAIALERNAGQLS